ncbi:hypothetical protein GCM10007036_21550 [Alsobacter metallidurans]|uniref:Glycine zipper domain-containing protein n=1 Tax=Alsobacter metallidurans TaxID=340221 RepID=A0A917I697_9HYPH|nr:hypothetical protein GCM10007036_21550 [Alsobacter metallidurans]
MKAILSAAALCAFIIPGAALAQNSGVAAGATTGAVGGAIVGGPVGAAVGGVAGAIVGGTLDTADRPRVQQYVVQQHRPSVAYDQEVVVGTALPQTVETYEVPDTVVTTTKQRTGWHYAVVNNRTVIVDNRTRKVIEVLN